MPSQDIQPALLTRQLRGREVSHLSVSDEHHFSIHFVEGAVLLVGCDERGLIATVSHPSSMHDRPTKRQGEYLQFISKYIHRFGRAPAESDIQRHFLVSAPSVNQMMQTLERRGFITRERGVARSIQVCLISSGPSDDVAPRS